MCYKNSRGRFYHDLTLKSLRPVSPSLLHWQFILREWIVKHIRKTILAPNNVTSRGPQLLKILYKISNLSGFMQDFKISAQIPITLFFNYRG